MDNIIKNIFFIIFMAYSTSMFSQGKKKIFVDAKEDFVVFIDNDITVSKKQIETTDVTVFVKMNNNGFNYTLLLSKIFEHDFVNGNLLDTEYENYFLKTCDCSIMDVEQVIYNNIKTLRYKIKVEDSGKTFIGFNDSFVSDGILYNVLFLTYESDFKKQSLNYPSIMNTLIINGRTTIDNYNEYERSEN